MVVIDDVGTGWIMYVHTLQMSKVHMYPGNYFHNHPNAKTLNPKAH